MRRRRLAAPTLLLTAVAAILAGASGVDGQVTAVDLVNQGEPVPMRITGEEVRIGRATAHALLASAHSDVTRPVTDADIEALGARGTLLRIRLAQPEDVLLLRLRSRARPSRLAAYVPPERDDRAFVFLGQSGGWDRIVVVALPDGIRQAVRRVRTAPAPADH
jgi:hypothetical protein